MTNKTWYYLTKKRTAVFTLGCMLGAFALSGTTAALAMESETGAEAAGTAAESVIGAEAAENFAFADAGVDPAAADYVSAKYDYDDGVFLYDVEFSAEGTEYEYHVQAADGSILKKSIDYEALKNSLRTSASSADSAVSISLDDAKETALSDTLLTEEECALVAFTKAESDNDDGISIYDIEFCTDEKKYEYEISILTGDILSLSEELLQTSGTDSPADRSSEAGGTGSAADSASGSGNTQNAQSSQDSCISVDEAKAIALEKAGFTADDVTFKKAKLDKEDGIMVYEIEFYQGTTEYEFEINAVTGDIREFEID